MPFSRPSWLWALLSIVPLVLVYLLRPRPRRLAIPSLMFLQQLQIKRRRYLLGRFVRDPLLLLQLFVLLAIVFAMAGPYILTSGGDTAIVLDVSASMETGFQDAQRLALQGLGSRNTVILAENIPILLVRDASRSRAKTVIEASGPRAVGADLAAAIMLAKGMLPRGGRILVVSDFLGWQGDDPLAAKRLAEAEGLQVDFQEVKVRRDNLGFVDGFFEGGSYKLTVRNFNPTGESVKVTINRAGTTPTFKTLEIPPGGSSYLQIDRLTPGVTEASLEAEDAVSLDNKVYIYMPPELERRILYLGRENAPSLVALRLLPSVRVETSGDPDSYPLVVSDHISGELEDYAKNGGKLLVIASDKLEDNSRALPVKITGIGNSTSLNLRLATPITEGIDLDIEIKRHLKAKARKGAVVLLEGGDGSPMLAYWRFGRGLVFYSGLADPEGGNIYDPLNPGVWNNFHAMPDYPVFWLQLVEWLEGSLDPGGYNLRAGRILNFGTESRIKTPTGGSQTGESVLLDEVGVYTLPERKVAVNMLNPSESDLSSATGLKSETRSQWGAGSGVPWNLEDHLILLAALLVLLELYILKRRGELWA